MRKWKWITTGVVLLGIVLLNIISREDDFPLKNENVFRVVSANIDFRNDQPEALLKRLTELEADVLILVEWIPPTVPENSISGTRTVIAQIGRKHGISINISNRLIKNTQSKLFYSGIQENTDCRLPMGVCRLKVGDKHWAVVGAHIPPPHLAECKKFTNATLQELAGFVHDGKLKEQLHVAQPGDPVIILGDLNAHPFNPNIQHFEEIGLINVIGQFGKGINPTWPTRVPFFPALHAVPFLPLFRIDHILVSKEMSIKSAWTFQIPGSDHRGVACDITF